MSDIVEFVKKMFIGFRVTSINRDERWIDSLSLSADLSPSKSEKSIVADAILRRGELMAHL